MHAEYTKARQALQNVDSELKRSLTLPRPGAELMLMEGLEFSGLDAQAVSRSRLKNQNLHGLSLIHI